MKLLFDENLSPRLVGLLVAEFPGSEHVRNVGLAAAADPAVWSYAAAQGLVIVSLGLNMQLIRYREEMSAAIDAFRRSLAIARGKDERRNAIFEAKRWVKRIQKKAKHLISDRVTQNASFYKMKRNRIINGQQDLLLIDEMTSIALAAIDEWASGSGEPAAIPVDWGNPTETRYGLYYAGKEDNHVGRFAKPSAAQRRRPAGPIRRAGAEGPSPSQSGTGWGVVLRRCAADGLANRPTECSCYVILFRA